MTINCYNEYTLYNIIYYIIYIFFDIKTIITILNIQLYYFTKMNSNQTDYINLDNDVNTMLISTAGSGKTTCIL